ncbi:precorrin-6A/cobalt-precorrin-6A reductase, partial [Patescibacteria group bacterium]|nr:precorrin-6A/cobalt-precorrin-6A reductase [Patescibacteria group bacterium]
LNIAMFKEYKVDFVVMKDSGIAGGTAEKVKACQKLEITPIIIGRKPETGYTCIKSLAECLINEN